MENTASRSAPRGRPRRPVAVMLAGLLAVGACAGAPGPQAVDPGSDIAGLGAAGAEPVGEADAGPVQAGGFPDPEGPTGYLTDVRSARQDGFDRIVLEFTGDAVPSHRVSYVEPPVRQDGSGQVVGIEGDAFLQLRLTPAAGVDLSGEQPRETYPGPDRVSPPRGEVVEEVVRTGDFEANLAWTAGLTRRLPFAVAAFTDPARLVVDVAHEPAGPGEELRPIGEPTLDEATAESSGPLVTVTDVRLGAHDGFDRVVVETAGDGRAGYRVGYVDDPRAAGSGAPVAVPGAAALGVTLTGIALPGDAPAGTQPWDGPQRQRIAGSEVLVELVEAVLFEGRYTFFAGVDGRAPFAVGRLEDPSRIVLDISTDGATPPGQPVGLTQDCTNPDGFGLSYPQGWATDPGNVAATCTRFAPEPFEVEPATDTRPAPIAAYVEAAPFATVAAPDPEREQARATTAVGGRQAVRIERIATGAGLYGPGTPSVGYAVDLGADAGTLVLDAVGLPGFDHARNVGVLDRMVRTLQITAGAPADETVVAAYGGGGGAFGVTAVPDDRDRICLRIPPQGQPSCVPAPAADAIGTTPLIQVGDQQVLTGVAGAEVFRVRAERPGAEPLDVLPAPVPGTDLGGFAFPVDPAEVGALTWFDLDGQELGSR